MDLFFSFLNFFLELFQIRSPFIDCTRSDTATPNLSVMLIRIGEKGVGVKKAQAILACERGC
jgi:hypothetical protein